MEETTFYPFEYTILTTDQFSSMIPRVIKPQLGGLGQSWVNMRSFHPMFLLLLFIHVHTSSCRLSQVSLCTLYSLMKSQDPYHVLSMAWHPGLLKGQISVPIGLLVICSVLDDVRVFSVSPPVCWQLISRTTPPVLYCHAQQTECCLLG